MFEDAAALQARRQRFVDEVHRDRDADDAVLADAQEVDVEGLSLDGIDLHVAGDARVLLAFDVEFERRRGEVALEDLLPQRR